MHQHENSSETLLSETFSPQKFTSILRMTSGQDVEPDLILVEHSYARPYNWQIETPNSHPRKTLFLSKIPKLDSSDVVDVEKEFFDSSITIPAYNLTKGKHLMGECERHVSIAKSSRFPFTKEGDYEEETDWEESINKSGWTDVQHNLFDKIVRILDSDRLAKLTLKDTVSEPLRRRAQIDKSAAKFRQCLGRVNWDLKLTQWLHDILFQNLSTPYLAAYLDILQTLKSKIPNLVDKMISISTNSSIPNIDAINFLLKRPWDPAAPLLNDQKPNKLDKAPIVIQVPSGTASVSVPQVARRIRFFNSQLQHIVKSVPVSVTSDTSDPGLILEQIMHEVQMKIVECRAQYSSHPIILVGWGIGGILACYVSLIEKVSANICLGFPMEDHEGKRGGPDDPLLGLTTPTLFVVGEKADNTIVEDLEKFRLAMKAETSLVVIAGTDQLLRMSIEKRYWDGLTQSMVDRCIVEEIGDFLTRTFTAKTNNNNNSIKNNLSHASNASLSSVGTTISHSGLPLPLMSHASASSKLGKKDTVLHRKRKLSPSPLTLSSEPPSNQPPSKTMRTGTVISQTLGLKIPVGVSSVASLMKQDNSKTFSSIHIGGDIENISAIDKDEFENTDKFRVTTMTKSLASDSMASTSKHHSNYFVPHPFPAATSSLDTKSSSILSLKVNGGNTAPPLASIPLGSLASLTRQRYQQMIQNSESSDMLDDVSISTSKSIDWKGLSGLHVTSAVGEVGKKTKSDEANICGLSSVASIPSSGGDLHNVNFCVHDKKDCYICRSCYIPNGLTTNVQSTHLVKYLTDSFKYWKDTNDFSCICPFQDSIDSFNCNCQNSFLISNSYPLHISDSKCSLSQIERSFRSPSSHLYLNSSRLDEEIFIDYDSGLSYSVLKPISVKEFIVKQFVSVLKRLRDPLAQIDNMFLPEDRILAHQYFSKFGSCTHIESDLVGSYTQTQTISSDLVLDKEHILSHTSQQNYFYSPTASVSYSGGKAYSDGNCSQDGAKHVSDNFICGEGDTDKFSLIKDDCQVETSIFVGHPLYSKNNVTTIQQHQNGKLNLSLCTNPIRMVNDKGCSVIYSSPKLVPETIQTLDNNFKINGTSLCCKNKSHTFISPSGQFLPPISNSNVYNKVFQQRLSFGASNTTYDKFSPVTFSMPSNKHAASIPTFCRLPALEEFRLPLMNAQKKVFPSNIANFNNFKQSLNLNISSCKFTESSSDDDVYINLSCEQNTGNETSSNSTEREICDVASIIFLLKDICKEFTGSNIKGNNDIEWFDLLPDEDLLMDLLLIDLGLSDLESKKIKDEVKILRSSKHKKERNIPSARFDSFHYKNNQNSKINLKNDEALVPPSVITPPYYGNEACNYVNSSDNHSKINDHLEYIPPSLITPPYSGNEMEDSFSIEDIKLDDSFCISQKDTSNNFLISHENDRSSLKSCVFASPQASAAFVINDKFLSDSSKIDLFSEEKHISGLSLLKYDETDDLFSSLENKVESPSKICRACDDVIYDSNNDKISIDDDDDTENNSNKKNCDIKQSHLQKFASTATDITKEIISPALLKSNKRCVYDIKSSNSNGHINSFQYDDNKLNDHTYVSQINCPSQLSQNFFKDPNSRPGKGMNLNKICSDFKEKKVLLAKTELESKMYSGKNSSHSSHEPSNIMKTKIFTNNDTKICNIANSTSVNKKERMYKKQYNKGVSLEKSTLNSKLGRAQCSYELRNKNVLVPPKKHLADYVGYKRNRKSSDSRSFDSTQKIKQRFKVGKKISSCNTLDSVVEKISLKISGEKPLMKITSNESTVLCNKSVDLKNRGSIDLHKLTSEKFTKEQKRSESFIIINKKGRKESTSSTVSNLVNKEKNFFMQSLQFSKPQNLKNLSDEIAERLSTSGKKILSKSLTAVNPSVDSKITGKPGQECNNNSFSVNFNNKKDFTLRKKRKCSQKVTSTKVLKLEDKIKTKIIQPSIHNKYDSSCDPHEDSNSKASFQSSYPLLISDSSNLLSSSGNGLLRSKDISTNSISSTSKNDSSLSRFDSNIKIKDKLLNPICKHLVLKSSPLLTFYSQYLKPEVKTLNEKKSKLCDCRNITIQKECQKTVGEFTLTKKPTSKCKAVSERPSTSQNDSHLKPVERPLSRLKKSLRSNWAQRY